MPRSKKTIYQKIEEKKSELLVAQQTIVEITEALKQLEEERDNQEMHILFQAMKNNNLDLEKTLKMLNK